jgi:hypothetical protein
MGDAVNGPMPRFREFGLPREPKAIFAIFRQVSPRRECIEDNRIDRTQDTNRQLATGALEILHEFTGRSSRNQARMFLQYLEHTADFRSWVGRSQAEG